MLVGGYVWPVCFRVWVTVHACWMLCVACVSRVGLMVDRSRFHVCLCVYARTIKVPSLSALCQLTSRIPAMLGAPVRRRIAGKQTRAVPRHRLYGK